MNRIDKKFRELRKERKKAFIAFIMAGDPSIKVTKGLVFEFDNIGVDIIELGVPFSDPLADGPVIQRASERARYTTISGVLNLVKNIRIKTQVPIVFLMYYNLIFHYGLERFVKDAVKAGVDGVVVPDLPPEESIDLRNAANKYNFHVIHLLAPTSPVDRIKKIDHASKGFIYYVSLTGTTGVRKELSKELVNKLMKIKKTAQKPICVGFGISTPEQVNSVKQMADGVIVGSAIIEVIENNLKNKHIVQITGNFVRRLRASA